MLFRTTPDTAYIRRAQRFLWKLEAELRSEFRKVAPEHMEAEYLEDMLIYGLKLFGEGDLDFLWAHSIHDSPRGTLEPRAVFIEKLKEDIADMVRDLIEVGYRDRMKARDGFIEKRKMRRIRDATSAPTTMGESA
jgi:hypothetical protein